MKNFKKWLCRCSGILASLALVVTTVSVNQTCDFWVHQPKLPQGAKNLRKF